MKRILIFILAFFSAEFGFGQIKTINITYQKTFGERSDITTSYFIEFKTKNPIDIAIDSVKGIADKLTVDYNFIKNDKGYYVIRFSQEFKKPEKCPTCRDIAKKQSDLTKGVIVYYKKIDRKSSSNKIAMFKVKKFKQLPDATNP